MENENTPLTLEQQVAGLKKEVAVLTKVLRDLSIDFATKCQVQGYALSALLNQRGTDHQFCEIFRDYVSEFLETSNPPEEVEKAFLLQMNVILEAAGEQPRPPDGE